MRILQINSCHYRRGGADVVYLNTGKLLASKGHEVYFFSQNSDSNDTFGVNKFFINPTNYFGQSLFKKALMVPRFFYSYESKSKIEQLIIAFKPEIAHIHLYKADLTPAILPVLKRYNVPVIITLHDYGFLCPHNLLLDGKMEICERCIKGSPVNCIIHKCNRNNLILSTLSAFEFSYQKLFFPFEKYFTTILAVSKFGQRLHNDSKRFKRTIKHLYNFYPQLIENLPTKERGDYFLYFGRFSGEKGILTLIDAWTMEKRNSVLKMVGAGELMSEISDKVAKDPSIQLLGFKKGEELINLIKNASFIIVPSEWYENNPLTIVEAYANGKPVIGSNVGGIPEIVEDGKTGFLFEMKKQKDLSAKIGLAEKLSVEEYETMSINSRKFAEENFNPELHYLNLLEIYNQTIQLYQND